MRSICSFLFAYFVPLLLFAQQPEDVRLSPIEVPYYNLPTKYRIQSADQLGNRTLVVWGTTRNLDSANVAGELHYQVLDGATLLDSQKVLTDATAQPFDFVQVIAGAAFFIVVWRDARTDAPGLYAQRVDRDGNLLGKVIRISPGYVKRTANVPGILVFGSKDRLLVWVDGRSDSTGLYALPLSRSGALGFPVTRIGGDLRELLHFHSLPGLTFLRTSDTVALMVHPDGRVDKRTVPWPGIGVPYNLGPDTSLVTLRGKRLDYFTSLFEGTPVRTVELPALDSAVASSVILTREGIGNVTVQFFTLRAKGAFPDNGTIQINGYQIPITVASEVGSPLLQYEHRIYNWITSFSGSYTSFAGAQYSQGCDNTALTTLTFRSVTYAHGNERGNSNFAYKFSVDADGHFYNDSTAFILNCLPTPSVAVSRIAANSLSRVEVTTPDTVLVLAALVAGVNPPAGQTMPQLTTSSSNNTLLCYWRDQRLGTSLLYRIAIPFREVGSLAGTFGSPAVNPDDLVGDEEGEWCATILSQTGLYLYPELPVYVSNQRILCYEEQGISYSRYFRSVFRHYVTMYFPGDTAWCAFYRFTSSPTNPYGNGYRSLETGRSIGYDPDRQELLIALDHSVQSEPYEEHSYWSIAALNRRGATVWTIDTLSQNALSTILPVDSLRYVQIADTSATLYNQRAVVTTYSFPSNWGPVHYQSLLGPYFLRSIEEAANSSRHLEVYHVEGRLVASTNLAVPLSSLLIQRRTDSAIALLWGTDNGGVHAVLLDKHLQVIIPDTVVSATRGAAINPTGIFVGDTLYVAWQDYRNGQADIYGTGILLPLSQRTSTVERANRDRMSLVAHIRPNPAHDIFCVEFNRPLEFDAELELFDMLGALAWRGVVRAGTTSGVVPVSAQQSGAYRLRWKSGETSSSLPVVITR